MMHTRASMLVQEALKSSTKRKRKVYREALRNVLRAYLTYVDANLIISHQLDLGFHDWLDFTLFYTTKFLSVGRSEDPVQAGREQLEKLFTLPFPELAIRSTRALMKALSDKRIDDLRLLVAEAVEGAYSLIKRLPNQCSVGIPQLCFKDGLLSEGTLGQFQLSRIETTRAPIQRGSSFWTPEYSTAT
jgi:hypothetical protein